MAKKKAPQSTSKSQAIRNFLAQNPSAMPKEIVAALNKKGIEVSEGLASNVKYTTWPTKKKKKKTSSKKKRTSRSTQRHQEISAAELLKVKKLVDQLGGITQVREALNLLEQLQ